MFGASKSGSAALPSDPDFEYVTLLLDGNGTNGGQNNTFIDSSTNNFTITRNGNTTQGSFSPYGSNWSNYFDGSSMLTAASSSDWTLGTGDFTIEAWMFPTSLGTSNYPTIVSNMANFDSNYSNRFALSLDATNIVWYNTAGNYGIVSNSAPQLNVWTHVAIVRSSSTITMYVNGVAQTQTQTSNQNYSTTNDLYIGGIPFTSTSARFFGNISNLRIVKGSAVYTSNFTPSTTPLTAVTNTTVLTCQSNRFIDNSSTGRAITISTGSPSVQRFSPFEPSAPYDTSVIGGSGYFDGSGDFLNIANNTAFNLTGNFTVDGWMYSNDVGNYSPLIACIDYGNSTGWSVWQRSNATIEFNYNGYNGQIQSSTITTGVWNHFAVCLTGTTLDLYLNGVRSVSTTISAINSCSQPLVIGGISSSTGWNNNFSFNGYLANLRVVKDSVLYSGTTYTVPTAPTTAVSGTGVLTNFTNASIADYAMMNNLETAGNAQISTSVKKFGTGSLSFDGTGDYLRTPATNYITPLAGDFTIECWIYFNSVSTQQTILGTWESPVFWELAYINGTGLRFYPNSSTNISIGGTLSTSTWYHVAIVRSGSTITTYLDGTSQSSATFTSSIGGTSKAFGIGSEAPWTGLYFNGYLDDVRITNGVARYTSNFTAPTAPFPIY